MSGVTGSSACCSLCSQLCWSHLCVYKFISLGHTASLLPEPALGKAAVTSTGSSGPKRGTRSDLLHLFKSHSTVFLTPWEKRKAGFPFGEILPSLLNRIFIQSLIYSFFATNMLGKVFTLKFPSSLPNLLTIGSLPSTQVLRKTSGRVTNCCWHSGFSFLS